jgi:hypothetical protein
MRSPQGWSREFDEPIPLPRGRALVTLKDAGNYITKLPKGCARAMGMMMITRRHAVLLSLMLAACSSDPGLPESTYKPYAPPSPPTEKAVVGAVPAVAAEAKLSAPLQISAVRQTDHGLGLYFICLREANPPPDKRQRYYSVFFDNDAYKGDRLSVIMDQCELQTFSPLLPTAAPTIPAANAKPARQKAARSSTQ